MATSLLDLLRDALGGVAILVLAAAIAWTAWAIARAVLPKAPTSVRWSGAAVGCFWLPAALFWVTAPLGLFRLEVLLPAVVLMAWATHRFSGGATARADLRRDLHAARARLGALARRPAGWLLAATGLVAAVRTLRGSVAPPLGWDSMTYHLFKAGLWVQSHGLVSRAAPDAWGNYEYFPVIGDLYWAWAMLPFHGDLAIAAAGLAVWSVVLLATYAAAVVLGARPERAASAAAAVGAMPSVLAYLSSGYVDNTTLALFLLGALFVARLAIERRPIEAPLAVAALALMLGVKLTTAGLFAAGGMAVVWLVTRSSDPWRTRRLVLLACVGVAVVGAPSYLRAWVEQGSPFFPFPIAFGDMVLSEGSEDSGKVAELFLGDARYHLSGPLEFWWFFLSRTGSGGSFVNPGPGILVLGVLSLLALPSLRHDRRRLLVASCLLVAAALMFAGFLSGNMELFRRTIKVTTAGRYLTPAFAALAVVAARWNGRGGGLLWGAAVLAGLWLARPVAWAPPEPAALLAAVLVVAVAGVLVGVASIARRRGWLAAGGVAATVAVAAALAGAGVGAVRAAHRYEIWSFAADPSVRTFHMHPLHRAYAAAWPLWRALDERPGHRLAVTAGWDGVGHNWYQYPLLGSDLQNRVLYVPLTADGSIVDYRDREAVARRASAAVWLQRLVDERVDHVVSLAPRSTIEDHWMRSLPAVFEPAVVASGDLHVAFRLDREAAIRVLSSAAARPQGARGAPGAAGGSTGPAGPGGPTE